MFNSNYSVLEQAFDSQSQVTTTVYLHNITKAKIVHIDNKDTNRLFAVVFATPSWGSTGVAHILEHSVLCGTTKYPHKELFGELGKISQASFLNAMTFPDKTIYPVASNNAQDFFNLQSAYIDSVFSPLVIQENGERIFQQEGHHLELDEKGVLIRKGVVYNEMKGAYSTADHWLLDACNLGLYPDTCYSQSSGGIPSEIGKLTYEEFKDFYTKFYHPSNSTIFLTGANIEQRSFDLVDEYLSSYDYLEVESIVEKLEPNKRTVSDCAISYQSAFTAPKTLTLKYPETKSALIWATSNGNSKDLNQVYWHKIARKLLIGNSSSPLRKALEDSKLGSNFYYGDPDEDALAQIYNTVGLLGVEEKDLDQVTSLINSTLAQVVIDGFDTQTIEAVINSLCLKLRENSLYPDYPKNLGVMINILNSSLYGGSVLEALSYDKYIAQIKEEINSNPKAIQDYIQKYWLDNPHKVVIKMIGDPEFLEKIKQEEAKELETYQESLSTEELENIKTNLTELNAWQSTPITQETLDSIPRLSIEDIPKNQSIAKVVVTTIQGFEVLNSELESNGIDYIGLVIDTSNLNSEQLKLLPIYLDCLTEIDTENYTTAQIKNYLNLYTGGLNKQIINLTLANKSTNIYKYHIQGTALNKNSAQLSNILQEIIYKTKFNPDIQSKLKQLITQKKSLMKEAFLDSGHRHILSHLSSQFNQVGKINQSQSGYQQILFLEKLELDFDAKFGEILSSLVNIQSITNSVRPIINLGGNLRDIKAVAQELTAQLSSQSYTTIPQIQTQATNSINTNQDLDIIYDTQVNYVGQVVSLPSDLNQGAMMLANQYLSREYLWNKVRIQGGAYGAFAVYRSTVNLFGLASYRDPNQEATYQIFDSVGSELKVLKLSQDELNKLKIGTVGNFDNHNYPDEQIAINLQDYLDKSTPEHIQNIRNQILSATIEDLNQIGEIINAAQTTKLRGAIKAKS